jgi:uncharacterized membrane protein YphA (DoxX/SURF4 family)
VARNDPSNIVICMSIGRFVAVSGRAVEVFGRRFMYILLLLTLLFLYVNTMHGSFSLDCTFFRYA